MNCPRCGSPMAVVENGEQRYRECTRCGQCAPMDETQPPYAEMRGPPQ